MKFLSVTSILCFFLFACQSPKKNMDKVQSISDKDTVKSVSLTTYDLAFGFLNSTKDSVLVLSELDSMSSDKFQFALVNNTYIPLSFVGNKPSTEDDNGRQTAYNFHASAGPLFKLQTQPSSGEFALLVGEGFSKVHQVVPVTEKNEPAARSVIDLLEKRYNRKIIKSTQIAVTEDHGEFHLNVFELQGDSALAVCSYLDDSRLTTIDFPALYDAYSTWRVDDGGEFDAELFQVLSVVRSTDGVGLVTVFWGAEGYSLDYYISEGAVFKPVSTAYGYSAPM